MHLLSSYLHLIYDRDLYETEHFFRRHSQVCDVMYAMVRRRHAHTAGHGPSVFGT